MDIKEKIEELVEKIKKDDSLMDDFKKDPVKVVEKLVGVDLPDDMIEKVVDGVKVEWPFEIWHYSGGYWGNNTCKIMDNDFKKTAGGVADLGASLTIDYQEFDFPVANGATVLS